MTRDANTWPDPARPGVPLDANKTGSHWAVGVGGNFLGQTRAFYWTERWDGTGEFLWDVRGYSHDDAKFGRDFRYLGPCLTPAEVEDRVAEARRAALLDAHQRVLLFANTSYQHGNLPVDPHECAAQVAMEIAQSINAIDPDIRKAGAAISAKARSAALEEAAVEMDCSCQFRLDVLAIMKVRGERQAQQWCGQHRCCAIDAATIRALGEKE